MTESGSANAFLLVGERRGRVRDLPGFQKGGRHHEPADHFEAADAFIRRIGEDLVKADLDELYRDFREYLGLRRKEIRYQTSEGHGIVEIPCLTAEILLSQDEQEAKCYVLRTQVRPVSDESDLLRSEILKVLEGRVSQVIYALQDSVDVEATIDRIEENESLRPFLDYRPDGSELTLRPSESGVTMHLTEERAIFSMGPSGDLAGLLKGAFALWPQIRGEEGLLK